MPKIGAAKVITKAGPIWCHMSQSSETTKLRRYLEGTAFQVTLDEGGEDEIDEFVPLNKCKTLVSADGYSFKNVSVWTKILQLLEAGVQSRANASSGAFGLFGWGLSK